MTPLPYGRQWIDDADVAAVVACLRGDWLTQGPAVERFEQALCESTGAKYAVAVASGTAGLHLACLAAGVRPGDTGVTSAITFVASANAIAYCGGEPHFADVDPTTGLIDIASLETSIDALVQAGRSPRVIVPVDFAGQPADLPAVCRIADRCGAIVIQDAAHSLGASYKHDGQLHRVGAGTHATATILSFHPVKPITTAEGGAVLTNDVVFATRVRELRTHGIHKDPNRLTRPDEGPWYYEQAELGCHYRITDMQCALGLSQLDKLTAFIARRNELARRYNRLLTEYAGRFEPLNILSTTAIHGYHLYVGRLVPRPGESIEAIAGRRKALFLHLRESGIIPQVHYIPVPMQPYYAERGAVVPPAAAAYYASCLTLPLFPEMADTDVDRVVVALRRSAAL